MKTWMDIGAQAVCTAACLGGLAVAVWVLLSGMPGREGIDAMFLLVIALAVAVFFGIIPASAIRRRKRKLGAPGEVKTEARNDRGANA